jgi:hypothetical protein
MNRLLLIASVGLLACGASPAIDRPGVVYKVFQFPPDKIPRIDGKTDDWDIVPEDYVIGTDQLADTSDHHRPADRKDMDVRVRVGWVKGLNRLYFLYEAYDNYWEFGRTDGRNDMFELVVDGDFSGGPFISNFHPAKDVDPHTLYRSFTGAHAQNWHIFTPAEGMEWVFVWGCQQQWLRRLPYSNAVYSYNFKPGESGKLVLEFWITPFDYASCEGPGQSVESRLSENKVIGMSWFVKDYDDSSNGPPHALWNLSRKTTMYGDASDLVAFRLMPLEPAYRKTFDAQWSSKIVDLNRRVVAFFDESAGEISKWRWDFGDGTSSTEQHPIHAYEKPGEYTVTLYVEGPRGKLHRTKFWEVMFN